MVDFSDSDNDVIVVSRPSARTSASPGWTAETRARPKSRKRKHSNSQSRDSHDVQLLSTWARSDQGARVITARPRDISATPAGDGQGNPREGNSNINERVSQLKLEIRKIKTAVKRSKAATSRDNPGTSAQSRPRDSPGTSGQGTSRSTGDDFLDFITGAPSQVPNIADNLNIDPSIQSQNTDRSSGATPSQGTSGQRDESSRLQARVRDTLPKVEASAIQERIASIRAQLNTSRNSRNRRDAYKAVPTATGVVIMRPRQDAAANQSNAANSGNDSTSNPANQTNRDQTSSDRNVQPQTRDQSNARRVTDQTSTDQSGAGTSHNQSGARANQNAATPQTEEATVREARNWFGSNQTSGPVSVTISQSGTVASTRPTTSSGGQRSPTPPWERTVQIKDVRTMTSLDKMRAVCGHPPPPPTSLLPPPPFQFGAQGQNRPGMSPWDRQTRSNNSNDPWVSPPDNSDPRSTYPFLQRAAAPATPVLFSSRTRHPAGNADNTQHPGQAMGVNTPAQQGAAGNPTDSRQTHSEDPWAQGARNRWERPADQWRVSRGRSLFSSSERQRPPTVPSVVLQDLTSINMSGYADQQRARDREIRAIQYQRIQANTSTDPWYVAAQPGTSGTQAVRPTRIMDTVHIQGVPPHVTRDMLMQTFGIDVIREVSMAGTDAFVQYESADSAGRACVWFDNKSHWGTTLRVQLTETVRSGEGARQGAKRQIQLGGDFQRAGPSGIQTARKKAEKNKRKPILLKQKERRQGNDTSDSGGTSSDSDDSDTSMIANIGGWRGDQNQAGTSQGSRNAPHQRGKKQKSWPVVDDGNSSSADSGPVAPGPVSPIRAYSPVRQDPSAPDISLHSPGSSARSVAGSVVSDAESADSLDVQDILASIPTPSPDRSPSLGRSPSPLSPPSHRRRSPSSRPPPRKRRSLSPRPPFHRRRSSSPTPPPRRRNSSSPTPPPHRRRSPSSLIPASPGRQNPPSPDIQGSPSSQGSATTHTSNGSNVWRCLSCGHRRNINGTCESCGQRKPYFTRTPPRANRRPNNQATQDSSNQAGPSQAGPDNQQSSSSQQGGATSQSQQIQARISRALHDESSSPSSQDEEVDVENDIVDIIGGYELDIENNVENEAAPSQQIQVRISRTPDHDPSSSGSGALDLDPTSPSSQGEEAEVDVENVDEYPNNTWQPVNNGPLPGNSAGVSGSEQSGGNSSWVCPSCEASNDTTFVCIDCGIPKPSVE